MPWTSFRWPRPAAMPVASISTTSSKDSPSTVTRPGVHRDAGADDVAHQLLDVDPAGAGPPPAPGVAWLLGSPPAGSPGRFGSVGAQCEKPARTLTQASLGSPEHDARLLAPRVSDRRLAGGSAKVVPSRVRSTRRRGWWRDRATSSQEQARRVGLYTSAYNRLATFGDHGL